MLIFYSFSIYSHESSLIEVVIVHIMIIPAFMHSFVYGQLASFTHEYICILPMCIHLCVCVHVQITNIAIVNILYLHIF